METQLEALLDSIPCGMYSYNGQRWLVWNEHAYQPAPSSLPGDLEEVFKEVFKPFEIHSYLSEVFGPSPERLSRPLRPLAIFLNLWRPDDAGDEDAFSEAYGAAKDYYLKKQSDVYFPRKRLQELSAEIATLEQQVSFAGERIGEILESLKAILKVWLAEALRTAKSTSSTEQRDFTINRSQIVSRAQKLWWLACAGQSIHRRALGIESRNWIRELLLNEYVPDFLVDAQAAGILFTLKRREAVLEYIYPVDARLRALDWLLDAHLRQAPVLALEEVRALGKTGPGRPPYFLIEDTRRWFNELRDKEEYKGIGGRTKLIDELIRLHGKKSGITGEPDVRTMQRHLSKIKEEEERS